jgi:glycosyltransferase involved in cell wall biosynthesis
LASLCLGDRGIESTLPLEPARVYPECIAALVHHTRRPWELIVVENGSTDGTAIYLAGVHNAAVVPVTAICNRENRGFPAAINQGLAAARGEYLVMLNNDLVVTDARLDQLTALTTAKTGREANDSTAKDAKSAKEEREGSGKDEFVDESMTMERERASVTDIDSALISLWLIAH